MAGEVDQDKVFRALADPTRRRLLDRLRERNGQTLGELCAQLGMARQSATQHLQLLVDANLVSTVRRGREKWHHLNPVPIHEIQQRWIATFEQPRLRALHDIKRRAEEHDVTDQPTFVYVTYIHATAQRVWHALTDAELTGRYWGHQNVSDWQPGSRWEHQRTDGSGVVDAGGTVLDTDPPRRLVMTFGPPGAEQAPGTSAAGASVVTFEIEPHHDIVRLTVTHENIADPEDHRAAAAGWAAVLANLKSLLETGRVLPQAPWEMHAELRDAQLAKAEARRAPGDAT